MNHVEFLTDVRRSSTPPLIRSRSAETVEYHPVFLALAEPARDAILADVQEHALPSGELVPDDDRLRFISSGLLIRQAPVSPVCVGLVGPGSAIGWERAATGVTSTLIAVDSCRLWETPIAPVIEVMGQAWLNELVARQAVSRLRTLEADAACNASHLLLPRLAKWLTRLHRVSGGGPLALTQSMLADMLGVQRTSVNAAALQLQTAGLLRFRRGRIEVLDARGLAALACGCV